MKSCIYIITGTYPSIVSEDGVEPYKNKLARQGTDRIPTTPSPENIQYNLNIVCMVAS